MSAEFRTGVKFHEDGKEYRPSSYSDAGTAFLIAGMAVKGRYHRVIVYVKQGEDEVGVPYSEIQHLKPGVDLERRLVEAANRLRR